MKNLLLPAVVLIISLVMCHKPASNDGQQQALLIKICDQDSCRTFFFEQMDSSQVDSTMAEELLSCNNYAGKVVNDEDISYLNADTILFVINK